jgi:molybdopterin converting factor subunit 1
MECSIKAFGVSREIVGSKRLAVDLPEGCTIEDLKSNLFVTYPALADLRSIYIAVNNEYAESDYVLKSGDEVALIPPVSGG